MFKQGSLGQIMHEGSSKKNNDTNWMSLEPCIPPGVTLFTLHVPIESDLQQLKSLEEEYLVHQG